MNEIICSNCGKDCGGNCITKVDFDQLIKDGEPIKALRVFATEGYENGNFGYTRKQLLDYAADKLEKQGEARRITEQNDEIRNLKLEIKNLKKGIGKSSLDVWSNNSNVNARNKDAIKLLKSMNMAIDGIWGFACDNDYLFSSFNISPKSEETYKAIEKEIGTELIKIAEKIEVMRSVVVGDSLDWENILESLEVE